MENLWVSAPGLGSAGRGSVGGLWKTPSRLGAGSPPALPAFGACVPARGRCYADDMVDGESTAAAPIGVVAAREAVPRLRRRRALAHVGIYLVMLGEAALSQLEGRPGWAVFWCVLFALFGALYLVGWRNDLRREAIVLAAPDDAVRAYLRARLDTAARSARANRTWLVIGAVFLLMGYADMGRDGPGAMPRALGNFLIGGYFVVSRLAVRFLQAPRFDRELEALGGAPPDPGRDPALVELTRRILAERGPVQAAAFWSEITGLRAPAARKAVAALPPA